MTSLSPRRLIDVILPCLAFAAQGEMWVQHKMMQYADDLWELVKDKMGDALLFSDVFGVPSFGVCLLRLGRFEGHRQDPKTHVYMCGLKGMESGFAECFQDLQSRASLVNIASCRHGQFDRSEWRLKGLIILSS